MTTSAHSGSVWTGVKKKMLLFLVRIVSGWWYLKKFRKINFFMSVLSNKSTPASLVFLSFFPPRLWREPKQMKKKKKSLESLIQWLIKDYDPIQHSASSIDEKRKIITSICRLFLKVSQKKKKKEETFVCLSGNS